MYWAQAPNYLTPNSTDSQRLPLVTRDDDRKEQESTTTKCQPVAGGEELSNPPGQSRL